MKEEKHVAARESGVDLAGGHDDGLQQSKRLPCRKLKLVMK